MFFLKAKNLLGVDIGSSSIKIAEVRQSGKTVSLVDYAQVSNVPMAIRKGRIYESDLVAASVRSALDQLKTRNKKCAIGLAGTTMIVKKISVPQMDPKLLAEQIGWEAEQYIPFNIEEVQLAYHIIGPSAVSDSMDVLLIAAQKEVVSKNIEVLALAGLDASVVDISAFALANCFEVNYGKQKGIVSLLNIGAQHTNIVMLDNGKVVFARDVPAGGELYTLAIHRDLGLSVEDAESLKLGASRNQEVPSEVLGIIQQQNEAVANEIKNSFDFFQTTGGGGDIKKCFVTGGSYQIPGLKKVLTQQFGIPMDLLNPFQSVKIKDRRMNPQQAAYYQPFAALALGLAVRKLGDA